MFLLLAVSYPCSKRYFRDSGTEGEKRRRGIGFFSALFASVAGFHGWLFWRTCQAPDHCGRIFELNCQEAFPVVYLTVMVLGFSVAIVLGTYEIARTIRARGV
jgi:hypothetical protein